MKHELKSDSNSFNAVFSGDKTCEVRYNDRDYSVMDELVMRETKYSSDEMKKGKPLIYTGAHIIAWITHILYGPSYGIKENYVVLSIRVIERHLREAA